MVQFEAYQGKGSVTQAALGLRGSVVIDLTKLLPTGPSYKIYFDNFFTSPTLLDSLARRGFGATGTVRANRTDKCPVITPEVLKKQP